MTKLERKIAEIEPEIQYLKSLIYDEIESDDRADELIEKVYYIQQDFEDLKVLYQEYKEIDE